MASSADNKQGGGSDDQLNLPFPCTELTTPCRDIFHRNDEGRGATNFRGYYFTIPADHFIPSPITLADTQSRYLSQCFRTMLCLLAHLMHSAFMSGDPHMRRMDDGGRRFSMFFEYLLGKDSSVDPSNEEDMEAVSFLECVGVRFHIYLFDDQIDLMAALEAAITGAQASGGGGGGGGGGGDAGGDAGAIGDDGDHTGEGTGQERGSNSSNTNNKKKKKKKGGSKKGDTRPEKLAVYEKYVLVNSIHEWYKLCNAVNRQGQIAESDFTLFTDGNGQYLPQDIHPYHAERVFSWENSLVEGMRVEQIRHEPDSIEFPFPELVYFVTDGYATPFGLMGFTMPRTPRWYEQDEQGIKNTHNALMSQSYMAGHFEAAESVANYNDLRDIATAQEQRRKHVMAKLKQRQEEGEDVDVAAELRAFRNSATARLAKAWSVDAHVSEAIKAMVPHQKKLRTWTTKGLPVMDASMSHFGNLIAHMMMAFESVYEHSSNHVTQLRMLVLLLDAYRNECNMHNNLLLLGAGSKGKSFMMSCFQDMMVPGTTQFRLYETAKAATTDKDENDVIRLYDEATPAHLGDDKSGAETGSALMKGLLSECRVKVDSIVVEDGKRKQISIMAEKIGTQCLATNERADKIPEALRSRYILVRVHDVPREGFDAVARSVKTKSIGALDTEHAKALFQRRMQVAQTLTCMVEKAIYAGQLADVNIQVFTSMQTTLVQYMHQHTDVHVHSDDTRNFKAQQRFARTLTIINAVDKFVNDVDSPGYDPDGALDFSSLAAWSRLEKIQPYLFCTEEVALFCIDINADQIIRSHNYHCLEILTEYLSKVIQVDKATGEWRQTDDGLWESNVSTFTDMPSLYRCLFELQSKDTYPVLLSEENLKVAFNELRAIKCRTNGKALVSIDNSRMRIIVNAAFVEKNFAFDSGLGRYVSKINPHSIIRDAFLKGYCNKFTRPQRRMVTGSTFSQQLPYLLNVLDKKPVVGKELNMPMPISAVGFLQAMGRGHGDGDGDGDDEGNISDEDEDEESQASVLSDSDDDDDDDEDDQDDGEDGDGNGALLDALTSGVKPDAFFKRVGPDLIFNRGNIEDFFYESYLEKCGFKASEHPLASTLIRSRLSRDARKQPRRKYPFSYAQQDVSFMPKRSREDFKDNRKRAKRSKRAKTQKTQQQSKD